MSHEHLPASPVEFEGVAAVRGAAARRRYWKSLDELAQTPAFLEFLHREFPEQASMFEDAKGRREFLTLMGASLALAGLTACTKQPEERILPYVRQPETLVPGRPLFFATAASHDGYARGLLVESHEGRPTKVEGNPDHPASLGATDVVRAGPRARPLRSRPLEGGALPRRSMRTWGDFRAALRERAREAQGEGRRGPPLPDRPRHARRRSPRRCRSCSQSMPAARWVSWEPVSRDNTRAGAVLAFGEPVEPQYRFDQADVILSLEADFVSGHPASLRLRARVRGAPEGRIRAQPAMNRLYVVEGSPTPDRRVRRSPPGAAELGDRGLRARGGCRLRARGRGRRRRTSGWRPIVEDLKRAGAKALVLAGESQPPAVHALAHAINEALGAVGTTVSLHGAGRGPAGRRDGGARALVEEMQRGEVEMLVVLGANPVYAAPADLSSPKRSTRCRSACTTGSAVDETRRARALASPGVASARELGRPARGGRNRDDRPAADRAALPHALGDRGARRLRARRRHAQGLRRRARALAHRARRGRLRHALEPRAPRRRRRGQRLSREAREDPRRRLPGAHGRRSGRARGRVPPRPGRLRRTLRQPRLAAGAAEAPHQGHLGQRWRSSARGRRPSSAASGPSRRRSGTSPRSPS